MRLRRWGVTILLALSVAGGAGAIVFEERGFSSAEQEQRYRSLIEELRCLVCQNQSLADSEADLAGDLRRQVYTMLRDGAEDREIIDYMVARYGDFVLYRPPLKMSTIALWIGPFLLGLIGLLALYRQIGRRRAAALVDDLSPQDQQRLRDLLAQASTDEDAS